MLYNVGGKGVSGMLELYRANIILKVVKPGEDGEPKESRVTLNNVRIDLTTAEIMQLIDAFQTLISHQLSDAELVHYSYIS